MIFGNDRNQLRALYFEAWRKHESGENLEPLEKQIAAVIAQHPEYQRYLKDYDAALTKDFLPEMGETNPFLHMGLHIAIQEQIGTGRPEGIVGLYKQLLLRCSDSHEAEHQMIDCLAETLWEAQRNGPPPPDEQRYLERVKKLLALS